MRENSETTSSLTRRRFVQLSGVTGASTILAGTSLLAGSNLTSADDLCKRFPSPCGGDKDNDYLWQRVQQCSSPPPSCPVYKPAENYAVLYGTQPPPTHNFLLVPTQRIKGIECPTIWENPTPDYWHHAWYHAHDHQSTTEVRNVCCGVGLGINSVDARTMCQLHIHMAGIHNTVKAPLDEAWKSKQVAVTVPEWAKKSPVQITGSNRETHTYRVLWRQSLEGRDNNPFVLLHQMVQDHLSREDMGGQTLIVTRLDSGPHEGFYILNSSHNVRDGTNTCDPLLDRDM